MGIMPGSGSFQDQFGNHFGVGYHFGNRIISGVFTPLNFVVRLTVFSSTSRSHDETQKSNDKQSCKL